MTFSEVVQFLESLQIMPKTMPGLQKIKKALEQTDWYSQIDPNKVVVVAGTNGKGSSCAALEALLLQAGQSTGFYSSPHLVSTTERIRINQIAISESEFVNLFEECAALIEKCELSHFEALTLMAGHYFFSGRFLSAAPDFVIFEVGLGGEFDATNAFPHKYNMITKLGLDHTNILGNSLDQIAKAKFGIVGKKSIVVYSRLSAEALARMHEVRKLTNSNWVEVESPVLRIEKSDSEPKYFLNVRDREMQINLLGLRAAENIMNAVTMFEVLGFDLYGNEAALMKIKWPGRMQKVNWPAIKCSLYLSGDHNEQGVESLKQILSDFRWKNLHLLVGIGADKASEVMLKKLCELDSIKLYLTETPFKGLAVTDYPTEFLQMAVQKNREIKPLLESVAMTALEEDLCVVTGSLYLVGEVLKLLEMM